jgi:hypothetical protein
MVCQKWSHPWTASCAGTVSHHSSRCGASRDGAIIPVVDITVADLPRPAIPSETKLTRTIQWLLDGDPSIRWQTMRDLAGTRKPAQDRERSKIAQEGWGVRLLAKQNANGAWAEGRSSDGGLYSPKWISTTYTLLTLRDFGLLPKNRQAQRACALLLEGGMQPDGGVSYGTWARRTRRGETCISGMVLSLLAYFGYDDPRLDTIADYLLREQMSDGGWNCQRPSGATHSSMNTTISVLEGLYHYALHDRKRSGAATKAQARGREFLLLHRLFRAHRTGNVIKTIFTRLSFPPRWHYDILRALDYFQTIDAPRDNRLAEAIELLRAKMRPDGRWILENSYTGKTYFMLEHVGRPSRWNTLRALRVLKWWD